MTKQEKILKRVQDNKELQKNFTKLYGSFSSNEFIMNAERYIQAIKEGRAMCDIVSVSASGMSRVLNFKEMNGSKKKGFRVYNFNSLFVALGFSESRNREGFRINGCGMDMIFHTNYTIIHNLHRLGFINKKQCAHLAQQTPHVV